MPAITRLGDTCTGHDACPPRPLITGSPNVFSNDKESGRVQMDQYALHGCPDHSPHSAIISSGSPNVFINNKQVGRIGDPVSCGGSVLQGSPNIFINESGRTNTTPELTLQDITNILKESGNRPSVKTIEGSYDDLGDYTGYGNENKIIYDPPIQTEDDTKSIETHDGLWLYVYKVNSSAGRYNGRLYVIENNNVLATYKAATGTVLGDKQVEGDHKTPVGEFTLVDGPINSSRKPFQSKKFNPYYPYGPYMWHLSCGHGVALHGCHTLPNGSDYWVPTYGCVRVT